MTTDQIESLALGLPLLVALVLFLVRRSKAARREEDRAFREFEEARDSYQQLLAQLRSQPHNAQLRSLALERGRHYARLTRENGSATLFDEVALGNDINAACGGLASGPATTDLETRLRRLGDLLAKGLIEEKEYLERRREILREL
jgi:hypothetical protein